MALRAKGVWIIAVVAAAMAAGAALYYFSVQEKTRPPDDGAISQVPTPGGVTAQVPYEFIWRDGDVRGVDVPTKLRIPSTGKIVPIHLVQDMASQEGEGKIEFLHRVREVMVGYSEKHSHEACGEICSDGSTHSIRITTNAAVTRCAVAPICMAGQTTTLESIHSHCPARGRLKATLADEYLSQGEIRKGITPARCDTERFSAMDMAGRRPGWLAGRGALHQHDGPARVSRHEVHVDSKQLEERPAPTAN